jgi:hypothetical protein
LIGCLDQAAESAFVQFFAGAQLHMTHALAPALEQAGGIGEHRALEETDIRMSLEGVDISKWRLPDTSDRTTVVQQFADVGTAPAHAIKPCPRHQSERIDKVGKPGLNLRVSSDRAGEPQ